MVRNCNCAHNITVAVVSTTRIRCNDIQYICTLYCNTRNCSECHTIGYVTVIYNSDGNILYIYFLNTNNILYVGICTNTKTIKVKTNGILVATCKN